MNNAMRYHISADNLTILALTSVVHANGSVLSERTRNEVRLAHSLALSSYGATCEELEPYLGSSWAITQSRSEPNRISHKQYYMANVKAIAKRLGLDEKFVLARFDFCRQPDFYRISRQPDFADLVAAIK